MNEIIQELKADATNGKENFCYISENKLLAIKELAKREHEEKENLIKYLEDKIKELKSTIFENSITSEDIELILLRTQLSCFEDILEKVKSGKYE